MSEMHSAVCRRLRSVVSVLCALLVFALPALGGGLPAFSGNLQRDIELPDVEGRQRTLDEFRGEVVIVHFWASWCTPCIEEFPRLLRMRDTLSDHPLTVVGINVAEGERRAFAMARRLGLDFPVLLDRDRRLFDAWGAQVLPTTFVLDRNGVVRYAAHGPVDWDRPEVIDTLRQLM